MNMEKPDQNAAELDPEREGVQLGEEYRKENNDWRAKFINELLKGKVGQEKLLVYLNEAELHLDEFTEDEQNSILLVLENFNRIPKRNYKAFERLALAPPRFSKLVDMGLEHRWKGVNNPLVRDFYSAVRADAVLRQYGNGVDAVQELRQEFLLSIGQFIVLSEQRLPNALRLLLSPDQIEELRQFTEGDSPLEPRSEKELIIEAGDYVYEQKLKTGMHEKLAVKNTVDHLDRFQEGVDAAHDQLHSQAAIWEGLLKKYPDPRILVDRALGAIDGRLPIEKNK